IIVETVGVGQSETMVASMVDFFLALLIPAGGDELQGIKKGLIELADAIVINKADIDPTLAKRSAQHYRVALHILEPASRNWTPPVLTSSAISGDGVAEVWAQLERHREIMTASGERAARRATQNVGWMWSQVNDRLGEALRTHPTVARLVGDLEPQVRKGLLPPGEAADRLLRAFGLPEKA
ncbi:MAG: methylmalonyl Co-A mutase-associated GTPase MeaB, partial [Alphaproteobacteria bacterium]